MAGAQGRARVPNFDPAALVRARSKRVLSQDALVEALAAAGLRLDRSHLIRWEKGRQAPSPASLVALAGVLGIEPWELTTARPSTAELADLRMWTGRTQAELAEHVGMPRSTYVLLERGGLPLRPDVADALAAALDRRPQEVRRAVNRSGRGGDDRVATTEADRGARGPQARNPAAQKPVAARKAAR
jgi:transcriptional regulator with XRE-family HTH domain